jgi:hypothetical protein
VSAGGEGATLGVGNGSTGGADATGVGNAGTVKVPEQSGQRIGWPAYCSGTVSGFWQFGHNRFISDSSYRIRIRWFVSAASSLVL